VLLSSSNSAMGALGIARSVGWVSSVGAAIELIIWLLGCTLNDADSDGNGVVGVGVTFAWRTLGRALTETSKNANSASNKVEGTLVYILNDYSVTVILDLSCQLFNVLGITHGLKHWYFFPVDGWVRYRKELKEQTG
jgi:hypothetical protein